MSSDTKPGANATEGWGRLACAAASPTGTSAGGTGNRKLTVTGGGSSVAVRVITPMVGVSKKERIISSNKVGSPRKWPNDRSL